MEISPLFIECLLEVIKLSIPILFFSVLLILLLGAEITFDFEKDENEKEIEYDD